MIKKILKASKGITLIALVVTIVVLLILSGIAINLTIGKNGIFSRANEAVIANENGEVYEQLQLKILDYQLKNLNIDEYAILEMLVKDGYIVEFGILNVNLLMGKDMKTGNGNPEDGDLYLILENPDEEDTYNLIYYNSNHEFKDLGKILTDFDLEDYSTPTPEEYFEFDEATGSIALKDADSYYYSNAERYLGLKALVIPSTYNGKEVKQIGIRYYENDYDSVGHIMGINNLADVNTIVIPSSVEILNKSSFSGCKSVKNIIIPDSVTSIGYSAFYGCSGLTNITLPDSVTNIESYAFSRCSGLTNIKIPNSVTSIGNNAFSKCTGLTNLTIPENVTSIESYAFSGCTGLAIINVDENNKKYDSRDNCNAIIDTSKNELVVGCRDTIIPKDISSIGRGAFYGCTGLTNITIPDSVTSIGDVAFYGCTGLTNITIPDSVTSIGTSAFYECTGLTNITIPNGVTSIGNSAFYGCTGLTNITIPESVTSIGDSAFSRCTGLTDITIPSSVTNMDSNVFYGCTSLETIHVPFNKGEKPKGWSSSWSYECHATIIYSNGEKEQL